MHKYKTPIFQESSDVLQWLSYSTWVFHSCSSHTRTCCKSFLLLMWLSDMSFSLNQLEEEWKKWFLIWACCGVRQFGLARVVICLWGSGWIVVYRLFSLVIYLSVCGCVLVWMCVCVHRALWRTNKTNLWQPGCAPALTLYPVRVFPPARSPSFHIPLHYMQKDCSPINQQSLKAFL